MNFNSFSFYSKTMNKNIQEILNSYLEDCVSNEDHEYCDHLIKNGALITGEMLCSTVRNNQYNVCEVLLKNGADVHVENEYCLRYASIYNMIEFVRLLMKYKADGKKLLNDNTTNTFDKCWSQTDLNVPDLDIIKRYPDVMYELSK